MVNAIIDIPQQCDLPDIPLHIYLHGQDVLNQCSPLILLLHGAGGDHLQFQSVSPLLVKAGYRVLTVDLRYHGKSQAQGLDFIKASANFKDMQADLEQVLEWYKENYQAPQQGNLIELIVGGLSMGGMLGQVCAQQWITLLSQHGYVVKGFVGIGTPSIHLVWPRLDWMDLYRNVETFDPATIEAAKIAIVKSAVHQGAQKETERAMRLVDNYILFQCLRACADSLPPMPVDKHVPEFDNNPMQLPQLLLYGESDEHTGKIMESWHALNTLVGINSKFVTIQDAGHMVPLDQGVHVAEEIIKFFLNIIKQ